MRNHILPEGNVVAPMRAYQLGWVACMHLVGVITWAHWLTDKSKNLYKDSPYKMMGAVFGSGC